VEAVTLRYVNLRWMMTVMHLDQPLLL